MKEEQFNQTTHIMRAFLTTSNKNQILHIHITAIITVTIKLKGHADDGESSKVFFLEIFEFTAVWYCNLWIKNKNTYVSNHLQQFSFYSLISKM